MKEYLKRHRNYLPAIGFFGGALTGGIVTSSVGLYGSPFVDATFKEIIQMGSIGGSILGGLLGTFALPQKILGKEAILPNEHFRLVTLCACGAAVAGLIGRAVLDASGTETTMDSRTTMATFASGVLVQYAFSSCLNYIPLIIVKGIIALCDGEPVAAQPIEQYSDTEDSDTEYSDAAGVFR